MRERIGTLTATLAVALLAIALAAPAAQALPAKFWGVVPQVGPTAEEMVQLKRGGVDSIRLGLSWSSVQPERFGAPNWSSFEDTLKRAAFARLEVLPFVHGAPEWAVPTVRRIPSSPPAFLPVRNRVQRAGWFRFLREAVLRYGPNGIFWDENPQLPRRPIRIWQIWNEPNIRYFVARPNPAEYGELVRLSYQAIRSVDRGGRLVLGGMFARPREALIKRGPRRAYFAADFLNRMYRTTRGLRRFYHGVALHPYTGDYRRLPRYIGDVRRILKHQHDTLKAVWLTELGWSSQPPTRGNSFAKGMRGQAKQMQGAFRLLRRHQRPWRVARVYWFSVDDHPGACNFCDGSGLFREGNIPKPAWYVFTRFAGGRPN